MRRLRLLPWILLGLLVISPVHGQSLLQHGLLVGAAGQASGSAHRLDGILGQFGAGYAGGTNHDLGGGFWVFWRETVTETPQSPPIHFSLGQNYPNPFNPSTRIRVALPRHSPVDISLYDPRGRFVRRVWSDALPAGRHELSIDASGLPSGVYWCRLSAPGFSATRKLILLK